MYVESDVSKMDKNEKKKLSAQNSKNIFHAMRVPEKVGSLKDDCNRQQDGQIQLAMAQGDSK